MRQIPVAQRGALKLADPAQKLLYFLLQYFGGMASHPASLANAAAGVPATAANKGIVPELAKAFPNFPNESSGYLWQYKNGWTFEVPLLIDNSIVGADLIHCLKELSTDAVSPLPVGLIPAGSDIPDTAGAGDLTIEQGILRNWRLLQINRAANPITLASSDDSLDFIPHEMSLYRLGEDAAIVTGEYGSICLPRIVLKGNIVNKPAVITAMNGLPAHRKDYPVSPYDVCDFSTYNTL